MVLALTLVLSMVAVMKIDTNAKNLIITLDPGHGEGKSADGSTGSGTDAAVKWGGINELYYNLTISEYTKERLEQYSGVEVYMTRTTNDFCPGLEERVDIAKSHNSDAIISIHNNMNSKESAHGTQIYIPNNNYRPDMAADSKACANKIMKRLNNDAGTHKNADPYSDSNTTVTYPDGSVADRLRVIRFAKTKGLSIGMIVECAFLSNQSDYENFFAKEEGLKAMGYAIADGLADYYSLTLGSASTTAKVTTAPVTTVPVTTVPVTTAPVTTVPVTTAPETTTVPETTVAPETTTVPETTAEPETADPATEASTEEPVTESETKTADTEVAPSESETQSDDGEKKPNNTKVWIIVAVAIVIIAIASAVFFFMKNKANG